MSKPFKALALASAMLTLALPAAAQPAQSPGAFVDVPGGKLWTETCGSGAQTMVLLHDGMLHSVTWDDVWPGLCKSFHVVRYDRRGYGRSPEAKAPYSPVDDLQAVMRAAGAGHAVIVGASSGGGIAVDFTLAHPDEVDRLVLIGPEVSGLPHSKYFYDRMRELAGPMSLLNPRGAIKSSWQFAPGDDANVDRFLKLLMANLQDVTHKDPAAPAPPAAPRLGEIKAPTLVLVGEADVADNQSQAGVVEYAIQGSTRVVVRKAGHMIYMERPAEFTDVVTRFALGVVSPGAEEALRRVIGELHDGKPDYSRMSPALASAIRSQLDAIKGSPLPRSVTFKAVGTDGYDVFIVVSEKGSAEMRILLGEGGRIDDLRYRPLP